MTDAENTAAKRYAAFISYAHSDEVVATRLHKALETFKPPKDLAETKAGRLSPIFRDAAELTAHHSLPDTIRDAVRGSRCLIVLCSPSAKASHWVNEEIRLFRGLHGEASILCALIEGTPETAFPPALLDGGREPLAAALGQTRDGFRAGVTQLAASMLGVGLDDLVQREQKRRRRRLQWLTAGALSFSAVMGAMAITAGAARNAAETSRTEAEKMVEFMLTDLKSELQPLGKLSVLDDVGRRVSDYYGAIPLRDMDDDRIARQARARHLLGQVALDEGNSEAARKEIQAAYDATLEVMRRNPKDTDAIFAHAQSAYWMGGAFMKTGEVSDGLRYWKEYEKLGAQLYAANPEDEDMAMEAAWGQHNLGIALSILNRDLTALEHSDKALRLWEEAAKKAPEHKLIKLETANTLSVKAGLLSKTGRDVAALEVRKEEIEILESVLAEDSNVDIEYRLILTRLMLLEIKNKTTKPCDIQTHSDLLEQLDGFHARDPKNIRWKINYRAYTKDFLTLCRTDFLQSDFNARLNALVEFARINDVGSAQFKADISALQPPP